MGSKTNADDFKKKDQTTAPLDDNVLSFEIHSGGIYLFEPLRYENGVFVHLKLRRYERMDYDTFCEFQKDKLDGHLIHGRREIVEEGSGMRLRKLFEIIILNDDVVVEEDIVEIIIFDDDIDVEDDIEEDIMFHNEIGDTMVHNETVDIVVRETMVDETEEDTILHMNLTILLI
ncbi:hypothetical protein Tco_0104073 [Tanacetum coccineum]